ncbi:hypothetical protein O0L34_g1951 [Tuta absoluta]|nr:hypothetical protein O0L34_g1951 [Tuta absoluta]
MAATSDSGQTYGTCRCCLSVGYYKDILDTVRKAYRDIFATTFNLQLTKDKNVKEIFCRPCIRKLIDATEFREMVVESEQKLLSDCVYNSPSIEFVDMQGGSMKKEKEKDEEEETKKKEDMHHELIVVKVEEEEHRDVSEEVEATAAGDGRSVQDNQSMNDSTDDDDENMSLAKMSSLSPIGLNYRRYLMSRVSGSHTHHNELNQTQGALAQGSSNQQTSTKPAQSDENTAGDDYRTTQCQYDDGPFVQQGSSNQLTARKQVDSKHESSSKEKPNIKHTGKSSKKVLPNKKPKEKETVVIFKKKSWLDREVAPKNKEKSLQIKQSIKNSANEATLEERKTLEHANIADETNTLEETRMSTKPKLETLRRYKRGCYVIKQKNLIDTDIRLTYTYQKSNLAGLPNPNIMAINQLNYSNFVLKHSNALPFQYSQGKYMCAYCFYISLDIDEVRNHSTMHDTSTPLMKKISFPLALEISELTCSICNSRVPNLDTLLSHLEHEHSKKPKTENEGSVMPFVVTKKDLKCLHCDEIFDTFGRLLLHSNKHYPIHICDKCGIGFPSIRKLKDHKYKHEEETRGCSKCGVMLATKAAQKWHMVKEHGKKDRYKCPVCSAPCRSYGSRARHLAAAHGRAVRLPCALCAAAFLTPALRNKHYRRTGHLKLSQNKQ